MNLQLALLLVALQSQALELPKKFLAPKPKPDAVLAKVGAIPIRASDVEGYLWDWRAYEAIQDIATYRQIAAEAKRQGVTITDAEIQKELDKNLEQVRGELRPGQTLQQLLLERGFPKSRLYMRVKSEQLLNKLVLKAFSPKNFVRVSTIVVRPRTEQASDLADALQRAEAAFTSLRSGEPWGEVLARHTDDPGALRTQGLLGWRELKAFPPTVQQEMAAMKPGAITKPAQTANGIQIFRIEALGSSAEGEALQELKDAYVAVGRTKLLEDLRKKHPVEILVGK